MKLFLNLLLRNKRWVGLGLGGLVLLAQYAGVAVPGEAPINPDAYMSALKDALYMVAIAVLAHHDGTMKPAA